MAEIKKEEFFKHLDNLTVLDLADYIKEFEQRYGIKAEMAAMPAVGAAAPAAAERPAGSTPSRRASNSAGPARTRWRTVGPRRRRPWRPRSAPVRGRR